MFKKLFKEYPYKDFVEAIKTRGKSCIASIINLDRRMDALENDLDDDSFWL